MTRFFSRFMRGTLIALLLTGSAQAEWLYLGRSDSFRVYLDPKLIRQDGDLVQAWQLMDFTTAQWTDAQTVVGSIRNLVEYDCGQPRFRTLAGEAYSEQMASGQMVAREQLSAPQWEPVDPGGTADKIRQAACGKR